MGEAVMVGEAAVTDLADSTAAALVLDSAVGGELSLFGEITAALVTVASVDSIATFVVAVFAISTGTS
jgi:hypothetical protein